MRGWTCMLRRCRGASRRTGRLPSVGRLRVVVKQRWPWRRLTQKRFISIVQFKFVLDPVAALISSMVQTRESIERGLTPFDWSPNPPIPRAIHCDRLLMMLSPSPSSANLVDGLRASSWGSSVRSNTARAYEREDTEARPPENVV